MLRFLSDKHRLNVAITRSKRALYVLGHLKSLKVQYNYSQCPCIVLYYDDDLLFQVNDHWKALINHAQSCNAVIPVKGSHSAVVNRILKTRHLKTQVDVGDHHKSGSSRDQQKQAAVSVHRQGKRHRSDSEVDRQHKKSLSITPTDPTQQAQCDPTTQRPRVPSSQVSGAPRRHTIEHEHLARKPVKQVQIESGVYQEKESSMSTLQQQPTQLKLSSLMTSGHSAHMSPDSGPSMADRTYDIVHSSPSSSHTNIFSKGRKRVAHKTDKEIKSQRQEHKLLAPVSTTSDSAPPSKRPRLKGTAGSSSGGGSSSSSKGGIRADLLKKMTKK